MVDLLGGRAADMIGAVQEDFKQADDARVVDLDRGIADRADGDWQGEALQQRKVDMDIEPLRLEAGKAIGDGLETLADGIEMVQCLFEPQVDEVVGDQLVAQSLPRRRPGKVANFSYCLRKAFLKEARKTGWPCSMRSMTVASLPRLLRFTRVPKISVILSAVRRHKPSSQLRSNSLWMGKLRLKMKLRQYSIWAIA
jgi:hypothetical protein